MTASGGSHVARAAAFPIAAVILVGCGLLQAPLPEWVAQRQPLEACGTEDRGNGVAVNDEARRCLIDAFQDGRGAELISTQTTVEGDPITRYIRVHENGTVEIFHDATRDRFGSGSWERLRCERIVPSEDANIFVEEDCESLPIP